MPAVMPVAVAMPTMVPMMMVPTHLSGLQLSILLHRCRGTGIDQRHCLRTSDRSRHDKKRADGHEAQNFRSVHQVLLHIKGFHASAVRLPLLQLPRRDAAKILESVM